MCVGHAFMSVAYVPYACGICACCICMELVIVAVVFPCEKLMVLLLDVVIMGACQLCIDHAC